MGSSLTRCLIFPWRRHSRFHVLLDMSRDSEEYLITPELPDYCDDFWRWNDQDKSPRVDILGDRGEIALFHPVITSGTAGVRGTRVLNGGRFYWEISTSDRVFGTSMMFGIGTKKARLHADSFVNLLGEDEHSWALSHEGLIWHEGVGIRFTSAFRLFEATTIGLSFDGINGTLAYYKDGVYLGVAFTDLHLVKDEIYPMITCTAHSTEMTLGITKRGFACLQDRCRYVIRNQLRYQDDIEELPLPNLMKNYIRGEADHRIYI